MTANTHETDAFLALESMQGCSGRRSGSSTDPNFYQVADVGSYEVVHFELLQQGSARADASLPSIISAIDEWNPRGVILLGIAFGKDDGSPGPGRQRIGDVLVSATVIDYESGKVGPQGFQSDASIPDSGRFLYSAFKHGSRTWNPDPNLGRPSCILGPILSGDKVVNDPVFKKQLLDRFPRAIGGEMEGRGAYAACRHREIGEWLIVKGICDWGMNKETPTKEEDQILAARTAASLLEHVLLQGGIFSGPVPPNGGLQYQDVSFPRGYVIYVGTTSSRLFEITGDYRLREIGLMSYEISDPDAPGYLDGIIDHVSEKVLPRMKEGPSKKLQKVFVDARFENIFQADVDAMVKRDFIRRFYERTGLYFNQLTKAQTEENLRRLFSNSIEDGTAIVTIGSLGVDILLYSGGYFEARYLDISLEQVEASAEALGLGDVWNEQDVTQLKKQFKGRIAERLRGLRSKQAIILKGELKFMKDTGYRLRTMHGGLQLTQKEYVSDNRKLLFCVDYSALLRERYPEADVNALARLKGFRYGHLLIEAILETLGNQRVIPRDDLTVHGNPMNAYVFNVVISGSTNEGRDRHVVDAYRKISKIGANVLSPQVIDGVLSRPATDETEYEHLRAIDACDVLFISNPANGGYVGNSTKREIYYAYALMKTIACWHPLPDEDCLRFIPFEDWSIINDV
ncbi:hypothetical protein [Actinomyces sp. W5033]|uniref:5'-methylthioadenosine/S-adenosylhomocysteine nucleosidase family protein n=1 Tax=Actinomyces sp. W5033 TaxID=3446479 RepID=UPI003EDF476E